MPPAMASGMTGAAMLSSHLKGLVGRLYRGARKSEPSQYEGSTPSSQTFIAQYQRGLSPFASSHITSPAACAQSMKAAAKAF